MAPEARFALMAACIYLPLGLGYASRRLGVVGPAASKVVSRRAVVTLEPVIACFAAWHIDLSSPGRALLVPLIGAAVSLSLLGIGFATLPLVDGPPRRRGAYVVSAMISNIGMGMGGFICYMLHGVPAQALVVLYVAHFFPVVFVLGCVIAGHYATGAHAPLGATLAGMARNPIILAPTGGLVAGLACNIAGLRPPRALGAVNAVALSAAVCIYAYSIGLTLRVGRIGGYVREVGALAATKFGIGPLLGAGVVFALGQWEAFDGRLWRVAVIEGAMPVGVFATVISNLFDLDRDLANSAWVLTTLAVAVVIPVLYIVTGA
ncbi:MAG: AEC family transporter [Candidatus Brocadiia bacterium]